MIAWRQKPSNQRSTAAATEEQPQVPGQRLPSTSGSQSFRDLSQFKGGGLNRRRRPLGPPLGPPLVCSHCGSSTNGLSHNASNNSLASSNSYRRFKLQAALHGQLSDPDRPPPRADDSNGPVSVHSSGPGSSCQSSSCGTGPRGSLNNKSYRTTSAHLVREMLLSSVIAPSPRTVAACAYPLGKRETSWAGWEDPVAPAARSDRNNQLYLHQQQQQLPYLQQATSPVRRAKRPVVGGNNVLLQERNMMIARSVLGNRQGLDLDAPPLPRSLAMQCGPVEVPCKSIALSCGNGIVCLGLPNLPLADKDLDA